MLADSGAQLRLLDIADLDRKRLQLEHQKTSLPELAELRAKLIAYRQLSGRLATAETLLSDSETDLRKVEAELQPVRDRLARNQRLVEGGSITDPKNLSALLSENEQLKTRISKLEDVQLDAMQAVEDAASEKTGMEAELKTLEGSIRSLKATALEQQSAIEAKLGDIAIQRARVAEELPADLVGLYDKIAARVDGVGVGQLLHGKCTGCGLAVNQSDLAVLLSAPRDEVLRCEECARILVRP